MTFFAINDIFYSRTVINNKKIKYDCSICICNKEKIIMINKFVIIFNNLIIYFLNYFHESFNMFQGQ